MQGLGTVLDDPNKMVLFHYICQLLPEEAQVEFDRVAATMLTGGVVCVCVCVCARVCVCINVQQQHTTATSSFLHSSPLLPSLLPPFSSSPTPLPPLLNMHTLSS